jgi:hypothetical protein
MAAPTPVDVLNGEQLLVQISDGASPEVFAADCLINTDRGIQFSSDTTEDVIPYCDAPDTPGWKTLTVDGLQATINGSGKLHTTSVPDWFAWYTSGESKNCRVLLNGVALAKGGGYWVGAFKLTSFQVTGQRKQKAESSVTLVSDGPVVWTDAAA